MLQEVPGGGFSAGSLTFPSLMDPITYLNFHTIVVLGFLANTTDINTVIMSCDLGRSWASIYGSSVGWLENTRMSKQPIC